MAQYPQGIFQSLQWLLKKVKILALQKQPTYVLTVTAGNTYTIPGRGYYYITPTAGGTVQFPNPALMNGQTITIYNNDGANDVNIAATYRPFKGVIPTILVGSYEVMTFTSINNNWITSISA